MHGLPHILRVRERAIEGISRCGLFEPVEGIIMADHHDWDKSIPSMHGELSAMALWRDKFIRKKLSDDAMNNICYGIKMHNIKDTTSIEMTPHLKLLKWADKRVDFINDSIFAMIPHLMKKFPNSLEEHIADIVARFYITVETYKIELAHLKIRGQSNILPCRDFQFEELYEEAGGRLVSNRKQLEEFYADVLEREGFDLEKLA